MGTEIQAYHYLFMNLIFFFFDKLSGFKSSLYYALLNEYIPTYSLELELRRLYGISRFLYTSQYVGIIIMFFAVFHAVSCKQDGRAICHDTV